MGEQKTHEENVGCFDQKQRHSGKSQKIKEHGLRKGLSEREPSAKGSNGGGRGEIAEHR